MQRKTTKVAGPIKVEQTIAGQIEANSAYAKLPPAIKNAVDEIIRQTKRLSDELENLNVVRKGTAEFSEEKLFERVKARELKDNEQKAKELKANEQKNNELKAGEVKVSNKTPRVKGGATTEVKSSLPKEKQSINLESIAQVANETHQALASYTEQLQKQYFKDLETQRKFYIELLSALRHAANRSCEFLFGAIGSKDDLKADQKAWQEIFEAIAALHFDHQFKVNHINRNPEKALTIFTIMKSTISGLVAKIYADRDSTIKANVAKITFQCLQDSLQSLIRQKKLVLTANKIDLSLPIIRLEQRFRAYQSPDNPLVKNKQQKEIEKKANKLINHASIFSTWFAEERRQLETEYQQEYKKLFAPAALFNAKAEELKRIQQEFISAQGERRAALHFQLRTVDDDVTRMLQSADPNFVG